MNHTLQPPFSHMRQLCHLLISLLSLCQLESTCLAGGTVTTQVYSCPSSVGPGELVNVQVRLMFSGDDNDGPWQVTHISLRDDDIWPAYNTIANVNTPFTISSQGTWYYYTFTNVRLSDLNDGGDGIEVYVETEVDDNDFNGYNPSGSSAIYQVAVCSVSTPSTPSGPSSGIVGSSLSFSTSGSTCASGHSVQYSFVWGDGTTSAWGSSPQSHSYSSSGSYSVKAQARCATRTTVVSSQSSGAGVTVNNHTVSTPTTPSGPSSGITGSPLSFSTSGSTCTAGHSVQYRFNWGDGTTSAWGSSSQSKIYSSAGNYSVTAQARCATDNTILSGSSGGKGVTITAHAVSTPSVPSGPSSGVTGVSVSYSTGSSSCNAGHSVEYRYTWGDGTTSTWGSSSQSKTYSTAGNYSITAQARCVTDNTILSGSSGSKSVSIATHSVTTPSAPSGPTKGSTGVQLDYSAGSASCNAGHSVQYRFEWGDGVTSGWGSSSQSHTYGSSATFTLRAQARCATDTAVLSSYSSSSSVMVAGNISAGPDRGTTTAQEYGDALYDNFDFLNLGYNYNHAGLCAGIDSGGVARIFESSAGNEPADPNDTPGSGPQEGKLYESFLIEGANYYGAYIPSTYAGTMPFADRRAVVSKAKEAVDDAGIAYPIVTLNAINYDSGWTAPLDPNEITDLRCDGLVEYAYERSGIRVWRNCLEADSEWNIAYYPAHHNNNPGNTRDPHFEMSPWAQRGASPATGPTVLGSQYSGPPWPDTKMTKSSTITLPTIQLISISVTTTYADVQIRATDESGIFKIAYNKPDNAGTDVTQQNPERHPTADTFTTSTIRVMNLGVNPRTFTAIAQDQGGNTKTNSWSVLFTPGKATNPSPANGATGVPVNQVLSWVGNVSATSYDVYFGTDSTPDSTEFIGNHTGTTYNPGTLLNGTTYYWRIDTKNSAGITTGDVWSFTTITLPSITIAATDATAGEPATGQGSGTFTFSRTAPTESALTVNFSVGGTAGSGTDYSSLGTSVSFGAGSATATKSVSVSDDSSVESDETVVVTLASGSGYTIGSPSSATITIKDDDATVSVSATDATAGEPASGQGSGTFTFSRSGYTAGALTVNFGVIGTAASGSDYASLGTTVSFGAGALTATKLVSVIDDSAVEGTEDVTLNLASGTGYSIGSPASATITISDDETVPVLTHSPSGLTNSVTQGQDATNQTFAVWNSSGGTLNYTNTVNQAWLSVTPSNGASTGEQDTIQVNYTTAGLPAGTNYATITIRSQVATNTIPVTLIVNPLVSPIIGVSGDLAFGNVLTNTTAQRTLTITNSGNAPLSVTGIGYPSGFNGPWSGNIPASSSTNVTVTFAPTALISYGGTVTVTNNSTSGNNTISAIGTGTAAPPQTGSLQVSLAPAGAVNAGAQWRVDSGAWQNSGTTVSGLSVGNHSVTFSTVSDWITPNGQNVTVSANLTTPATGIYVAIPQIPKQLTGMALSNGVFRFTLNGPVGSNYVIQLSSNLVNWLPFVTNTIPASGWVLITDPSINIHARRYYRAVPQAAAPPSLTLVNHIDNGGFARSVVVAGNYAYLANESDGLRIYDITVPANPVNVSQTNNGSSAWAVAVAGNFAYLANFDDGLRTYNIANPAIPVNTSQIDNGGQARGVAVAGNLVCLANYDDGLRIYTITNPTTPIYVGRTNNGGLALGVAVAGNYAYLANDADGLRVYNISNPGNPVNVGHTNNNGTAKNITVAGNYAYLANGNDGMRIYDISTPANPRNIAHIDEGGQARCIAVQGNYAYLANLDDGLRIYNISNPANPVPVGHVNDGGAANGVAVAGNYIYLANNDDGLRIYYFPSSP